jgi:hypothetical protein
MIHQIVSIIIINLIILVLGVLIRLRVKGTIMV